MDFLDQEYFENSVRSYLIVAGIILLALLFKRFLSRYGAALLFRLVKKASNNLEQKAFINLVVEPLELFMMILISVFSIDKLNFPERFNVKIYHVPVQQILESAGIGIIIISFFWLLLRFIDFIAMLMAQQASFGAQQSDNQLILFFKDFFKVIIRIIAILLVLKFSLGAHIGEMLTGLSIVGAAMALAAKESLENLIASFIIFFDKPFAMGDTVRVHEVTGVVERIGLRSTRIRTNDKTLVTVPNKQMVDSFVDNFSMRTNLRAELRVEMAPNTSAANSEAVIAKLNNLFQSKQSIITSYSVFMNEMSRNASVVYAEYFTSPVVTITEFNGLKQELYLETKKWMETNKIEMAAANNSVTIINTEEKKQQNNSGIL